MNVLDRILAERNESLKSRAKTPQIISAQNTNIQFLRSHFTLFSSPDRSEAKDNQTNAAKPHAAYFPEVVASIEKTAYQGWLEQSGSKAKQGTGRTLLDLRCM